MFILQIDKAKKVTFPISINSLLSLRCLPSLEAVTYGNFTPSEYIFM